MKILGIDFGEKRVGVAVSDDRRVLAFPKGILKNDQDLILNLEKIIKDENVSEIVIGESLNLSGEQNKVSEMIKDFVLELEEEFGLPVYTQKEFLTSVEARRTKISKASFSTTRGLRTKNQHKDEKIDDKAATLILQRYLDKKNNQKQK